MHFINTYKCILLIVLTFIIITLIVFFYVFRKTSENIICKKIGLILPEESEVVYFEHSLLDEDSVAAKIHIKEKDINDLLSQFNDESLFSQNYNYNEDTVMPNFSNLNDWFNVYDENIVYTFRTLRTDKKFKDKHEHYVWFFICKEDEEYYLYLSF